MRHIKYKVCFRYPKVNFGADWPNVKNCMKNALLNKNRKLYYRLVLH